MTGMRKRRQEKPRENPQLEMTSMIDVVFLLLIFFIVSLRQEDVLASMELSRPAPSDMPAPELVEVVVGHVGTGFSMNGRMTTLPDLDRHLGQLAAVDPTISIAIKCTNPSRHRRFIELLDLCAKHGLDNLSVHSLNR